MSKKNYETKVLKAVMAGTIALTPVIAIGVNVDKVSAATTPESVVKDFMEKFNGTSAAKKQLTFIVVNQLSANSADFIEANNPVVVKAFTNLLSFTNVAEVTESNLLSKFDKFKSEVTDVSPRVTTEELVTYFDSVLATVIENVNKLPDDLLDDLDKYDEALVNKLIDMFLEIYQNNKIPASLQSIVKQPTLSNVMKIVQNIKTAYNAYLNPSTPPSGGGGGFIPTPPPVAGDKEVAVDSKTIENNPQSVIDAINKIAVLDEFVINTPANATDISIPLAVLNALEAKNSNVVIHVNFGDVSYDLPVSAIDASAAAKQLGVAAADLKLVISATTVDNPLKNKSTYKVLSIAVDFKVEFVAKDGKSVEIKVFPTPVKRTLPGTDLLNPLTTVGVTVDANGKVTAVPTYIESDKKFADLYRSGNSVYTLIENSKTFIDVDKGASWAEEYIEKLASRMIVNGKTETKFQPTATITRGEFAAILSRGLGIVPADKDAKKFKDVSNSQAFNQNSEINAVVEAGIVAGYKDGTFRPYEEITRDQAAIMISRAIDYVGKEKVTLDTTKKASSFKDYSKIGAASRSHVERVYQAGFLDGFTDDTFRPATDADRGQTAKILYNFLASVKYIN